jgi:ribonuclease HI
MKKATQIKWIATQSDTCPIIGRKQKTIHENRILIKHYKRMFNSSPLEACKGCHLNETNRMDNCLFSRDTNKTIEIPVYKSQKSTTSNLSMTGLWHRVRMSPSSIQAYFDFKQIDIQQIPTQITPQISLDKTIQHQRHISKFLTADDEILNDLAQIRNRISGNNSIKIYTDGSLDNNNMGYGWILLTAKEEILFQGKIEQFPSSTRAELMAILTALVTLAPHTCVTIYSDSQAAIQGIKTRINQHSKYKQRLKNLIILENINKIINQEKLQITWEKIPAHTGIENNERADILAKQALSLPSRFIIMPQIPTSTCTPCWNNIALEIPIKTCIKRSLLAQQIIRWRLLNRNRITISNFATNQIAWTQSIYNIQPTKITSYITNSEDHNFRNFRNKLWNLELPTKTKLHNRHPAIYKDDICITCKSSQETPTHPFVCGNKHKDTINKIIQVLNEEISTRANRPCKTQLNKEIKKHIQLWSKEMTNLIIRGGITQKLLEITKQFIPPDLIKECVYNCSQRIGKFLQQTWKDRCDQFIKWEKKEKITKKDKRSWSKRVQSPNSNEIDEIKLTYPEITNKYMNEFINSSMHIDKIFTISLNLGIGSALAN